MTLDDAMEKFHKGWGHKREPAIYQIVNSIRLKGTRSNCCDVPISDFKDALCGACENPCTYVEDYTEQDLYELVWHLHGEWEKDRLRTIGDRWGCATSQIRVIMARRRERVADASKRMDSEVAEKLIANLHGAMGVDIDARI